MRGREVEERGWVKGNWRAKRVEMYHSKCTVHVFFATVRYRDGPLLFQYSKGDFVFRSKIVRNA